MCWAAMPGGSWIYNMEQIRSFIAIELPDEIKRKLGELEDSLRAGGGLPVKWVKPESIHLTLKFLGNITSGRTGEIARAIKAASRGVHPFSVEVDGTGVFPNPRRVRVVWVGLKGDLDTLERLQKNIEAALEKLGFTAEARGFTPHLTLGRVNERAMPEEREALGRLVTGKSFRAGAFRVEAVNLMRSQLTREGAIYTRLGSTSLK